MTSPRLLAFLSLLSVSLLLAALGMSAVGMRLPHVGFSGLQLPEGLALSSDLVLSPQLVFGLAAGWVMRWLYERPWSAMPRAVLDWLLGWRRSATMLGLAVGCMAVLLLT